MFQRLLIANRGEIALRIIRACRELDIEPICVYSTADADGPWLQEADQSICIGSPPAMDSYLRVDRIIAAAETTHADAIHPGYGFLAENAHFAEVCRDCNITFVGPDPEAMRLLGDKISCREAAKRAGTPVFPGSKEAIEDPDDAAELATEIGYPVIVKAAAGGGGRGMRIARDETQLRAGIESAGEEARVAFGDASVFIEKFLEHARHVEVQVIGDSHGNAIHLFNRDCTTQRRHQKLIEEGPAPGVDPEIRDAVCASAARLIAQSNYCGAATCEFLMDTHGDFYMLEVNTRVQVEHPVTEMITGVDIVKESIRVAAGLELSHRQDDIKILGHAIEFRVNAEDPDRNFMPQPGVVELFVPPGGPGVRVDSHVRPGYRIPPNYDSMIGKLIVFGADREEAIGRGRWAIDQFHIGPGKTTLKMQRRVLDEPLFLNATFDIHWLERLLETT